MSKDMQALLERISTKPVLLPATYEPPKSSDALRSLWSQVETRQWQKFMLAQLEFEIWNLDAEIHQYEHYKNCERCKIELQLGVERYMGRRGPWWLDLPNGDFLPEYYPDCPKIEDYNIGYYGHSTKDTLRFIEDRRVWAIKIVENQFSAACKLVKILENWDVTKGIPAVSWIRGMIDELAGNPTLFF